MLERLRLSLASWLAPKQLDTDLLTAMLETRAAATSPRRGTAEVTASYRISPWFRGVVSKVATNFAAVPWYVMAIADRPVQQPRARSVADAEPGAKAVRVQEIQESYDPHVRRRMLEVYRKQLRLVLLEDHAMLDLLLEANPVMTGLKARRLTQTYLDVTGEAFWLLNHEKSIVPNQYWPIPPHWVTKLPDGDQDSFTVTIRETSRQFDREDIVWFRDIDPADPYGRGSGIGLSLGDEIETDEYASKMIKTFFLNRGRPDLFIAVKGAKSTQLREAKEQFEREHRSFWRAHRTFWHGGEVTVKELQQKFSDMELADLRAWERDAIINVYGVPPEILGVLNSSNRATITAARDIFAEQVLIPRLEDMRAELQTRIAPLFDERIIVDYEPPIPDDKALRIEVLKSLSWAADRGEIREEFLGLPDRGDGDRVHMVPVNLIPERAPSPEQDGVDLPALPGRLKPLSVGGRMSAPDVLVAPLSPAVKALPPASEEEKATVADVDRWLNALQPERLTAELRPLWGEEFRQWGERVTDELGIDPTAFDMLNPFVANHLNDFLTNRIGDIDDVTLRRLRESLLEGVRAGEGIPELSRRVTDEFAVATGNRSVVIARTEVLRSSNAATYSAHAQSGVVQARQWVATADDSTRDTHLELNGTVVGLDEEFFTENGSALYPGGFDVAAEDIQCLPGSAIVASPSTVQKIYRRWYSGELVEVTAEGGEKLACTPNHPVLTQRGWIPAGEVNELDYLVRCGGRDSSGRLAHDEYDEPTPIEKMFDLLSVVSPAKRLVSLRDSDFHGDGREGQVDVVSIDRVLGDRLKATGLQQLEHFAFARADVLARLLPVAGGAVQDAVRPLLAANGGVCSGGQGEALGSRQFAHAHHVGSTATARLHTVRQKASAHTGPRDFEYSRERQLALTGLVTAHKIVGVDVGSFSGHVFNLQTRDGWYTCNGFSMRNCRCTTVAVLGEPRAMDDLPVIWRVNESEKRPWELQARRAFVRGFENQESDVLTEMRRAA